MGRLLAATAVALISLLAAASTTLASGDVDASRSKGKTGLKRNSRVVKCNGTITSQTIRDNVVVPANGACTLTDTIVKGEVEVRRNAYFHATSSSIRKDLEGEGAQTVFIDGESYVGGDVETLRTAQVFLFDSKIDGGIEVIRSYDQVHVCGNVVKTGIRIARSGRDILVGDPLAIDCAGNRVTRGSVVLSKNTTDVELVVRGNSIPRGNLSVLDTRGLADKFVQNNTGGKTIRCTGNSATFTGSPNSGWSKDQGQCNG
jgi:hypothetical protein